MTKDEALDLALEALEEACEIVGAAWTWRDEKGRPAITAIKQARALDKMADNARELGLDYEPDYKVTVVDDQHPNGIPLEQWGRPAHAQEPVAWVEKNGDLVWQNYEAALGRNLYTTPPAAVINQQLTTAPAAPLQEPPPECQTEAEKRAYAFGWWKALEANRVAPVQDTGVEQDERVFARIEARKNRDAAHKEIVQRQWVGLTRNEAMKIINSLEGQDWRYAVDAIEAKLKEKNT